MTSKSNNLAQAQIPILEGKNYEIWSMKMKSLLEYQGAWDIVSTDITDQTKDTKALYFIKNGLDDSLDEIVLRQISAAESSKKAWDILETKYKNAAPLPVNLHDLLFVAISAGFVLRLLFGDVPSGSGMQSFVLIEVFAMILLIYVIYKIAAIKITNAEFAAMAIGAVLGMIVGISGPFLGASMNPARTTGAVAGSSISIYMILGAVLGAIYHDVITPPSVPNGTAANGTNGTAANGTANGTNGTAANGTNGTATNGTAPNGTAANGTATNGTPANAPATELT